MHRGPIIPPALRLIRQQHQHILLHPHLTPLQLRYVTLTQPRVEPHLHRRRPKPFIQPWRRRPPRRLVDRHNLLQLQDLVSLPGARIPLQQRPRVHRQPKLRHHPSPHHLELCLIVIARPRALTILRHPAPILRRYPLIHPSHRLHLRVRPIHPPQHRRHHLPAVRHRPPIPRLLCPLKIRRPQIHQLQLIIHRRPHLIQNRPQRLPGRRPILRRLKRLEHLPRHPLIPRLRRAENLLPAARLILPPVHQIPHLTPLQQHRHGPILLVTQRAPVVRRVTRAADAYHNPPPALW